MQTPRHMLHEPEDRSRDLTAVEARDIEALRAIGRTLALTMVHARVEERRCRSDRACDAMTHVLDVVEGDLLPGIRTSIQLIANPVMEA